ncbi:MAG: hypothetical protein KGZ89_03590 [Actinobacteria bacterium]|nr:hypothetical protein [Actinomycetota bacterium]
MKKFGGSWSESKLDCVENYTRAYLKVMEKQHWCRLNYVDAFAGWGKQALKAGIANPDMEGFFGDESERAATEAFLVGSPIRALLFPLGGVIRMMTKNGQIPDSWIAHLDRLFGTHDWYEEFYRPSPQQALFDMDDEALMKEASTRQVVDYVRKRLSTEFAAVSNAGVLRNSKGAPLFALVLGVSSTSPAAQKAALSIANHLVKDLSQS